MLIGKYSCVEEEKAVHSKGVGLFVAWENC